MSVLIWVQTFCKIYQQMTKVVAIKKRVNTHIYLHCRLGLNVFIMARDFLKEDRYKVHKRFLLQTRHLCQEMLTIKRADFSIIKFLCFTNLVLYLFHCSMSKLMVSKFKLPISKIY